MRTLRRNLSTIIAIVVFTAMSVSCAVGPRSMALLDPLPVSGDAATIAVWRENQFCGSYPLNYLLVDDRPIVALTTNQHTRFQVSAGTHSIGVFHSVIDKPLLVGSGQAALPVGAAYGMYGTTSTDTFTAGASYYYLLRSKCVTLDETARISLERLDGWPSGVSLSPENFVPPGKQAAKPDAP